mmetsp:Transcript_17118/g.29159  ORF Transcript_17118/g.29159 Transcript_17118/m.29159 type:complete len:213 (-) Transcript_17118:1046-1684(-)
MAGNRGAGMFHEARQGAGKVPVQVLNQILDVVIHPAHAIHRTPGTPNEAVQQGLQQGWGTRTQAFHDVRVSSEQLLAAIVVDLTIRPDRQQVLDHGFGAVQAARFDGPEQGREGLGAHRDVQQLCGPVLPRRHGNGLPQRRLLIEIDGLHDNRRTFQDHPYENLGDQGQTPRKSGANCFIVSDFGHGFNGRDHEGREQLHRNAIAHVPKAQR